MVNKHFVYIVYQVFVLPVCAVCCLCSNFSVVEASEFSKDSFFSWVKAAFFTPAIGVNIEVVVLDDAVFQPRQCTECKQRLGNGSARGDSEVESAERAERCCRTGVLTY